MTKLKSNTSLPLPKRLGDPLWAIRKFLVWLGVFEAILLVFGIVLSALSSDIALIIKLLGVFAVLLYILWFLKILPDRLTNAIYLRSFKNDRETWPIRKALQNALGGEFRMSGIRDPSRRWPIVFRFVGMIFFVLRYSTPKYMNLEAGKDWKARLWRSLGDLRCAFIDISEITPFVRAEIQLAYQCLGLGRILFIGRKSQTDQQCLQSIVAALEDTGADRHAIQMVSWDRATRATFVESVKSFVRRLPEGTPGTNLQAFAAMKASEMPEKTGRGWDWAWWAQVALGLFLALIVGIPNIMAGSHQSFLFYAWLYDLAFNAYLLWCFIFYLIDCGTARKHIVSICYFSFNCLFAVGFPIVVWGTFDAREVVSQSAKEFLGPVEDPTSGLSAQFDEAIRRESHLKSALIDPDSFERLSVFAPDFDVMQRPSRALPKVSLAVGLLGNIGSTGTVPFSASAWAIVSTSPEGTRGARDRWVPLDLGPAIDKAKPK